MVHLSLLVAQKVESLGSYPLAIGLFVSVSLLVSLCAKHSRKSIKLSTGPSPFTARKHLHHDNGDLMIPPRSPLRSAKQLISSISDKALPFIHPRKNRVDEEDLEKAMAAQEEEEVEENEGVWQKAILMGEKCQPPDFSGVIYYDYDGNRIAQMPKSPRANIIVSGGGSRSPSLSPSPTSFSFPVVVRDDNFS